MKLRLPVDLVDAGGPAEMTVRKIEAGESSLIRPKTKTRLEHARDWPDGLVDRILDGTATEDDLTAGVVRDGGVRPVAARSDDEQALAIGHAVLALLREIPDLGRIAADYRQG
ncbi:MAG: hypothetical protein L0I24_06870 [Pseudonocardia sp.]|nr:hypothetical protein [Pseudonocardia sp.]